mmetsp:Transcript_93531/g.261635  ORF Transcript_93531/g.261635 Transcript_93531/m.261635 type:complete len:222 (+) Transcript_93531:368-1033(+)
MTGLSEALGMTSTSFVSTWLPCGDSYSSTVRGPSALANSSRPGPPTTSSKRWTTRQLLGARASSQASRRTHASTASFSGSSGTSLARTSPQSSGLSASASAAKVSSPRKAGGGAEAAEDGEEAVESASVESSEAPPLVCRAPTAAASPMDFWPQRRLRRARLPPEPAASGSFQPQAVQSSQRCSPRLPSPHCHAQATSCCGCCPQVIQPSSCCCCCGCGCG